MKVIGSPSDPSGQVGLPIHTGWPPNLVIGRSMGMDTG